jgi:MurNAc alpha-1-phosphate uridylyltransferase
MLLAAGRGERMGKLTQSCPKPLLPVAGKPLLEHHLVRLRDAGVAHVVVNAAYLAEQIVAFLQQLELPGLQIDCSVETHRLETGGGILQALPYFGNEPFLVVNSDIWCDIEYSTVMARARCWHDQYQTQAHLVLVDNPAHNSAGDFGLDQNLVVNQAESCFTFAGVSVLWPALFTGRQGGHFPLAPLLREAAAAGRVSGEHYAGVWFDIGTPERYSMIQSYLQGEITGA